MVLSKTNHDFVDNRSGIRRRMSWHIVKGPMVATVNQDHDIQPPIFHTSMLLPGIVVENRQAVLLGTLLVAAALAYTGTSPRQSLSTSAASWTLVWAYTRFKSRPSNTGESQGRTLSWIAGTLLALSNVCERGLERGLWWAKVRRRAPRCIQGYRLKYYEYQRHYSPS